MRGRRVHLLRRGLFKLRLSCAVSGSGARAATPASRGKDAAALYDQASR